MSIVAAFVKILSGKETTRSRQNYGDPDRQTGPGWQPFKHLHNAHWRTISWRSKTRPRHTNTHTYIHTPDEMAIPQARLCLSLLEVEKRRVWKWASERASEKEAQDEVCYSASPRGARTTRGPGESAHCPHMPHTSMHARTAHRKSRLFHREPNMLQHLPKKSENECKLRLFSPPLPHCLTLVIQSPSAMMESVLHPFQCLRFSPATICRCHQRCK